jgi:hypothetical protein
MTEPRVRHQEDRRTDRVDHLRRFDARTVFRLVVVFFRAEAFRIRSGSFLPPVSRFHSRTDQVGTAGRDRGEPGLTQWAAKTLPAVQKHLDRARELQQKVR